MKLRVAVSEKQKIILGLENAYKNATSEKSFFTHLKKQGFEIYRRGGREVGIVAGRRFRFRTLGYDREVILALDKDLSRTKKLNIIARIREQQRERNSGRER